MTTKSESILCHLLDGSFTPQQAWDATVEWATKTEATVQKDIQSDPIVQAAITSLQDAGKAAVQVGADWAGTAASGELAALAGEAAALVTKYVPRLLGATAGPLGVAGVTLLQALGSVGAAAIQHEVANVVSGTPTPPPAVG